MRFFAFYVCVLLSSPAIAGAIYTYTDAEGNTYFTDRPPTVSQKVDQDSVVQLRSEDRLPKQESKNRGTMDTDYTPQAQLKRMEAKKRSENIEKYAVSQNSKSGSSYLQNAKNLKPTEAKNQQLDRQKTYDKCHSYKITTCDGWVDNKMSTYNKEARDRQSQERLNRQKKLQHGYVNF